MRRAARIDANQAEVVAALHRCGWQVLSLAPMGRGVPDILACRANTLRLIEVKDGSKPPSARKLTKAQVEWHKSWPVTVIERIEQVVDL